MTLIKVMLGIALVGGLFVAGRSVYRHLPEEGQHLPKTEANDTTAPAELTIILRGEIAASSSNAAIELYAIDFAATQREFFANPHPGKTFDDFLAQRTKGLAPIRARLDDQGRARVKLVPGNWWIHATATLANGEKLEWRLPISVGRESQTAGLSSENVYERTKKF
jgi:hypothetical protein